MSKRWATGRKAIGICDRSGLQFPLRELVKEPGTGFLVHFTESDGRYNQVTSPLNLPPQNRSFGDSKPLKNPRPGEYVSYTE
jgi:hypothetical protein